MNKKNKTRLIKLQIFLGGVSEDEAIERIFRMIRFYKLKQDLKDIDNGK